MLKDEVTAGFERGWSFTPLDGKKPFLRHWQKRSRATPAEIMGWIDKGHNIGLRTGKASGVLVIDVDRDDLEISELDLPPGPKVRTGKGWHLYFQMPDVHIGNPGGRLGPHIDIRGDGGQVVFPGSMHPGTGRRYAWAEGFSPADLPLPPLPQHIIDRLTGPDPQKPPKSKPPGNRYGRTALRREAETVRSAAVGTRNNTLNTAAFNAGQLVEAGQLERATVEAELLGAAIDAGLPESDARATIRSGLESGIATPRPEHRRGNNGRSTCLPLCPPPIVPQKAQGYVLIPGGHTDEHGRYFEVGTSDFARQVLSRLPTDAIYRRGGVAGELVGPRGERRFEPLSADRMRLIVDANMRLGKWVSRSDERFIVYQHCTRDMASVVLAQAGVDPSVCELRMLVSYPVFSPEWRRASPGYHGSGIYYDEPLELEGLTAETDIQAILDVLEDLTVDFPFSTESSRENFYGLLLTPLIRPALDGNTPFHCIISSLERTGKSKLAEEVLGGIMLGRPTAAMQITDNDTERDKRILSLLIRGDTIVHLDNLPPFIDSSALSSLLTAQIYQGRILGMSRMSDLPNNLTVVGSGNNIQATSELVKRTVPVVLQPTRPDPEAKTDFQHPNLRDYIRSVRVRVLECLVGAVELWVASGRHRHPARMGGFEAWSESVGGILRAIGYRQWRTNVAEWRRDADPQAEELHIFVEEWWAQFADEQKTSSELASLARELKLFRDSMWANSQKSWETSFAVGVLRKHVNTPIGSYTIRRSSYRGHRRYFLEPRSSSDAESD